MGNGAPYLTALWLADGRLKVIDGFYEVGAEDFEELLKLTYKSPEAFDLLRDVCASRVQANVGLTEAERLVTAGILHGVLERPKRGGRPRANNWNRDVLIYRGVLGALQAGFKLEKWETSSSDCAFSLVAEAFNDEGNPLVTYDVVKNVWRNAEKSGLKKEIESIDLAG